MQELQPLTYIFNSWLPLRMIYNNRQINYLPNLTVFRSFRCQLFHMKISLQDHNHQFILL